MNTNRTTPKAKTYDFLTELYDRTTFFDVAQRLINKHEANYYRIVFVNIDNFKVINEQYGIEKGDEVLKHVANCLKRLMIDVQGICGRVSADNFALLYRTELAAKEIIDDAYKHAVEPPCIDRKIRIRVGRYTISDKSLSVVSMYDRARLAASYIRENYEKNTEEYDDSMRSELIRKQAIIDAMDDGIKNNEFELWYQPQYNHETGAIIGAEVLVRWNRDGQYISPADFIPVFEQNGFIYQLDRYVWEHACMTLRKWIDQGEDPVPISVNVSRRDVLHDNFIDVITELIDKYNIDHNLFRLEVTESAFAEATGTITDKVMKLISMGFIVEIDDFGSGYSSLNTLKDVPASVIKLDIRFFESTKNIQRAGTIIESVIRMAKWLGMAIIAEGIEDKELADYLKSVGCYYIQGYYYAKPMPEKEYEELLRNSRKEPELSRLKRLKNLENNEFWNPRSLETLIFNSYVGGACIFEYRNGKTEIMRTNDQYLDQFGEIKHSVSAAEAPMVSEYALPEDREKFFETVRCAIDTSNIATCELRLSNGEHMEFVRVDLRVISKADDRVIIYGILSNMTKQRTAEMNERNLLRQLDTIVDSLHGAITATVYDKQGKGKELYVNRGFYSIFGYKKEEFDTKFESKNDLIIPEDRPKFEEAIRSLCKDGKRRICNFRAIAKNGETLWIHTVNSKMCMDGIDDPIILSVATDITEMHMLQEKTKSYS